MPGLDTYLPQVNVHASLKVATKSSFRGKKISNLALLRHFF